MSKVSTSQFRKGMFIEFRGATCQIVDSQHVNPGKGSAFVRTKLKNLKTGATQEFTYKAGEMVTELTVSTQEMQFLYKDGNSTHFMNNETYEQYVVPLSIFYDFQQYLKAGETYQLLVLEGEVVGVRAPKRVQLTVTETTAGVRGDTVSGATKQATLISGATVQVPLFIKEGDEIAVNPETGEYLSRT